jgi:hypothetical protein
LPVYDGGIDFVLHHEVKNGTRKVQLTGRWTIDKMYVGRQIWMVFPIGADWYLMPHDEMLKLAEADDVTQTSGGLVRSGSAVGVTASAGVSPRSMRMKIRRIIPPRSWWAAVIAGQCGLTPARRAASAIVKFTGPYSTISTIAASTSAYRRLAW